MYEYDLISANKCCRYLRSKLECPKYDISQNVEYPVNSYTSTRITRTYAQKSRLSEERTFREADVISCNCQIIHQPD